MALPVLAGVYSLGAGIASLVTSILGWIAVKLTAKAIAIPTYLFVSGLLIAGHLSMVLGMVALLSYFFSVYNVFIDTLNSFSSEHEIVNVAFSIMNTLGIFKAFEDVFAIFSPFIILYLTYRGLVLIYLSFQITTNELFKIGVLVQQ